MDENKLEALKEIPRGERGGARGVTSAHAQQICRRLENDYMQAFADAGGSGLDAWASEANIGVETRFGDRLGAIWATSVRYLFEHETGP